MGHARALLGTPDRAFQEQLARRVAAEGLSVREVEEAVRVRNESATPSRAPSQAALTAATERRPRAAGLIELEERLGDHLATRVQVTMGNRRQRGRIVVEFADVEDLERIYRLIAGQE
jgi:ParB family chromosome partitioning protein